MTLDFDDLPPLTERCTCTGGQIFPHGPDPVPCPRGCVDGKRPTKFGKAVIDLVRIFLIQKEGSECE